MTPRNNWRTATLLTLLACAGCRTVIRENIVSSINTGIGVSVAENTKTELYEVKVGYIRSQFYSVPTGKVVDGPDQTNQANVTPELVSGIRIESDWKSLFLGVSVSENFAVGETAVMSPAAVAMYVAAAKDKETAQSASEAAQGSAATVKTTALVLDLKPLAQAYTQLASTKQTEFDNAAIKAGFSNFRSFLKANPSGAQIAAVRGELEKDETIQAALK